jgi:hypothetical protein
MRLAAASACAESRRAERLQSHRNATDLKRYAMVVRELLMLMSVFYSFDVSTLRWRTLSPASSPLPVRCHCHWRCCACCVLRWGAGEFAALLEVL